MFPRCKTKIVLERGAPFTLQTEEIVGDDHRASLSFSGLTAVCAPVRPQNWAYYAREKLAEHGVAHSLALLALGPGTTKDGSLSEIQFVDLAG